MNLLGLVAIVLFPAPLLAAGSGDREPIQLDTVDVQATVEDRFPLRVPPPLPDFLRLAISSPDSVAVCLVDGRPEHDAEGTPLLRSGEPAAELAAGYPVRSDWHRLDADDAARWSELLLSVEEAGRRGEFGCIYAPLEVFRVFRDEEAVTVLMCHCTSNGTLEARGAKHKLHIETVNVELLEIVARAFPEDDQVLSELEDWRAHPIYGVRQ